MMQIARQLVEQLAALMVADPAHLGDSTTDFIQLRPIGADFTPRPDLIAADLDLAVDGLVAGSESMFPNGIFANTRPGDQDTWDFWSITASSTYNFRPDGSVLPLLIYGLAFCGNSGSDLWTVQKFESIVTFLNDSDILLINQLMFTMPISVFSNN